MRGQKKFSEGGASLKAHLPKAVNEHTPWCMTERERRFCRKRAREQDGRVVRPKARNTGANMRAAAVVALLVAITGSGSTGLAQDYPTRPIKALTTTSAGGIS